jgi:hypothetical protein
MIIHLDEYPIMMLPDKKMGDHLRRIQELWVVTARWNVQIILNVLESQAAENSI